MTLKIGQPIDDLCLPNIDGTQFELKSLRGQNVMVSFHRFATCPFCNLRIHQLVSQFDTFGDEFQIAAIFDSPLDHLQKHAVGHHAPFSILADEHNIYYRKFAVTRSVLGTIRGFLKRLPTVLYAMFIKGFWPFPIKGNIFSMPLELLIDKEGIIQYVHRGKDEGDHLSIDVIRQCALMGTLKP